MVDDGGGDAYDEADAGVTYVKDDDGINEDNDDDHVNDQTMTIVMKCLFDNTIPQPVPQVPGVVITVDKDFMGRSILIFAVSI